MDFSVRRLIMVPLPTPEGPQMTRGRGGVIFERRWNRIGKRKQ